MKKLCVLFFLIVVTHHLNAQVVIKLQQDPWSAYLGPLKLTFKELPKGSNKIKNGKKEGSFLEIIEFEDSNKFYDEFALIPKVDSGFKILGTNYSETFSDLISLHENRNVFYLMYTQYKSDVPMGERLIYKIGFFRPNSLSSYPYGVKTFYSILAKITYDNGVLKSTVINFTEPISESVSFIFANNEKYFDKVINEKSVASNLKVSTGNNSSGFNTLQITGINDYNPLNGKINPLYSIYLNNSDIGMDNTKSFQFMSFNNIVIRETKKSLHDNTILTKVSSDDSLMINYFKKKRDVDKNLNRDNIYGPWDDKYYVLNEGFQLNEGFLIPSLMTELTFGANWDLISAQLFNFETPITITKDNDLYKVTKYSRQPIWAWNFAYSKPNATINYGYSFMQMPEVEDMYEEFSTNKYLEFLTKSHFGKYQTKPSSWYDSKNISGSYKAYKTYSYNEEKNKIFYNEKDKVVELSFVNGIRQGEGIINYRSDKVSKFSKIDLNYTDDILDKWCIVYNHVGNVSHKILYNMGMPEEIIIYSDDQSSLPQFPNIKKGVIEPYTLFGSVSPFDVLTSGTEYIDDFISRLELYESFDMGNLNGYFKLAHFKFFQSIPNNEKVYGTRFSYSIPYGIAKFQVNGNPNFYTEIYKDSTGLVQDYVYRDAANNIRGSKSGDHESLKRALKFLDETIDEFNVSKLNCHYCSKEFTGKNAISASELRCGRAHVLIDSLHYYCSRKCLEEYTCSLCRKENHPCN